MAKEKKRGFFSWLGFGQKEQTPEKETEVQNEQPVVEEIVQAQEPVKARILKPRRKLLLPTLWKSLNRLLKVKKRSLKRKSLHSRNRSQKKRRSQWLSNVKSCRCQKTSTPKRFRQKSGRLKRKP